MTVATAIVLLSVLVIRAPAESAAGWGNVRCPLRAEFVPSAVGQSERALRRAYGAPTGGQDFILAQGLNPSRRSLRTLYPGSRFDRLLVRELGWAKADCRLIVWFVRRDGVWTAVQALRSNAVGEF